MTPTKPKNGSKYRVLLLTHRDSDNVGDQIIEATVMSLLEGAFDNLDIAADGFEIDTRATGIVSRAYMRSRDPELLVRAREAISAADVVVFGGAPLFNYTYQAFYLRTIITLELAQEYGVSALFSSIGVEPFNPKSRKSMALKQALALPIVRQITTRDDFESLQKYVEGTDTPIAHVSDPAVFADTVFRNFSATKSSGGRASKKRIGLVVTRAGIFKDNGIPFTQADQRNFWLEVIDVLTAKGYDYKLFTTGHCADEIFLESFVKDNKIPKKNVAVPINSPEELVDELSACSGVIAYRLHASITSFAYSIPSIGLTWNFKVPYFYESVGHGDRALDYTHWNGPEVVDALEKAMTEGVTKDEAFLMSVYETLFSGLKGIFAPDSERESYSFDDLREKLPPYPGTTPAEYKLKVRRKLVRAQGHHTATAPKGTKAPASLARRAYWKARRTARKVVNRVTKSPNR